MKGGESCLDTVGRKASVRARKHGPEGQKSRDGAPRGVCVSQDARRAPKRGTVVRHAALHPPRMTEGQGKG